MKKILITTGKVLVFLIGWALVGSIFPVSDSLDTSVWRFWAELIPLLAIVGFTLLFWLFEKKRIKLQIVLSPLKDMIIGTVLGILWIGIPAIVFVLSGIMKITACNTVPKLWLWVITVFINAAMQELLVRGYLYQMLKVDYNVIVATVITTTFFTFMHGGAFQAGLVPVLNVITMSLLMTIVLEYTQSLLVPTIMHFIWNCVGGVILGGVVLADDYPHLCVTEFTGHKLLSGGEPKIEGSIIVLILNIVFILVFSFLLRKRNLVNSHGENEHIIEEMEDAAI